MASSETDETALPEPTSLEFKRARMQAIVDLDVELKECWAKVLPPRCRAVVGDCTLFFPPFIRYGKRLFSVYAMELAPAHSEDSEYERILLSTAQTTVINWLAPCPSAKPENHQLGEWGQNMIRSWKLFKHADHDKQAGRVSKHFIWALFDAGQWGRFYEDLQRELTTMVPKLVLKAYEIFGRQTSLHLHHEERTTIPHPSEAPQGDDCSKVKAKPGPKRDVANARRVATIVERVAHGILSRDTLNDVCEALDNERVPCPRTWRKRESKIMTWDDAADDEPELAMKAIQHHLKNARK